MFRLLDDVEKGVFFQEVSNPPQRQAIGPLLSADVLVDLVDAAAFASGDNRQWFNRPRVCCRPVKFREQTL